MAQGMAENELHFSREFLDWVLALADASILAFWDPEAIVVGDLHSCFPISKCTYTIFFNPSRTNKNKGEN